MSTSRRIVGLCAICRLGYSSGPVRSFEVVEYAVLASGDFIILRSGLGWTERSRGSSGSSHFRTFSKIAEDVLSIVKTDDRDGQNHPWQFIAVAAREKGLVVSEAELREIPYEALVDAHFLDAMIERKQEEQ